MMTVKNNSRALKALKSQLRLGFDRCVSAVGNNYGTVILCPSLQFDESAMDLWLLIFCELVYYLQRVYFDHYYIVNYYLGKRNLFYLPQIWPQRNSAVRWASAAHYSRYSPPIHLADHLSSQPSCTIFRATLTVSESVTMVFRHAKTFIRKPSCALYWRNLDRNTHLLSDIRPPAHWSTHWLIAMASRNDISHDGESSRHQDSTQLGGSDMQRQKPKWSASTGSTVGEFTLPSRPLSVWWQSGHASWRGRRFRHECCDVSSRGCQIETADPGRKIPWRSRRRRKANSSRTRLFLEGRRSNGPLSWCGSEIHVYGSEMGHLLCRVRRDEDFLRRPPAGKDRGCCPCQRLPTFPGTSLVIARCLRRDCWCGKHNSYTSVGTGTFLVHALPARGWIQQPTCSWRRSTNVSWERQHGSNAKTSPHPASRCSIFTLWAA